MKLKICFLVLFILAQVASFSQQVRMLTLEIKSSIDNEGYNGKVLLKTEDGICQSTDCHNGFVDLYFFDYLSKDAFLVIRQSEGISKVSLNCLLNDEPIIKTPFVKIKVKENKFVLIDETDEISLLPNRQIEPKIKPDFSLDWQRRTMDTVYWYFPTVTLLDVASFRNLVSDSAYLKGYYNEYGFYPSGSVKDSLAEIMAIKSAEFKAGWYSWNLMQLKEPILCNGNINDTYRFTWIGNIYRYEYDPYSVRIEKSSNGSAIVYCSYKRESENGNGTLHCDIFSINQAGFEQFMKLANNDVVCQKSSLTNRKEETGVGGTRILEANIDGQYHVIFRGEGEDPALDELQKFLWNLTGLGENKIVHKRQRIE